MSHPAKAAERAVDILIGAIQQVEAISASPWDESLGGTTLADGIIAAYSPAEARDTLAAMSSIACVLLVAASCHTGNSPEEIILSMRRATVEP